MVPQPKWLLLDTGIHFRDYQRCSVLPFSFGRAGAVKEHLSFFLRTSRQMGVNRRLEPVAASVTASSCSSGYQPHWRNSLFTSSPLSTQQGLFPISNTPELYMCNSRGSELSEPHASGSPEHLAFSTFGKAGHLFHVSDVQTPPV